jgi:hypothetical protein
MPFFFCTNTSQDFSECPLISALYMDVKSSLESYGTDCFSLTTLQMVAYLIFHMPAVSVTLRSRASKPPNLLNSYLLTSQARSRSCRRQGELEMRYENRRYAIGTLVVL